MFININILSKNYKSLILFLNFFFNFCKKNNIKCNKQFINKFQKKYKIIKFKILKSPHVNKKAQKELKYFLFSLNIQIISFQNLKLLVMLKKMKIFLFSDIQIQIKILRNNKKLLVKKQNLLSFKKKDLFFKNATKNYLTFFDFFGELFIKSLNSSVVEQKTENLCVDSSKLSLNITKIS